MAKTKVKVLKNFSYEVKRKQGDETVSEVVEHRRHMKKPGTNLFVLDQEGYKKPNIIELSGDPLKFALKIKAVEVIE